MKKLITLLLAGITALSLAVPGAAASGLQKVNSYTPGQFTDAPDSLWCASNVQSAYEYGIMSGVSDSCFDVNGNLTVIQAIVMACRLHSDYCGDDTDFAAAGLWYFPYLAYAMENDIRWDYDDYDVPATRADFAVILGSALPDSALPEISKIEAGAIPDVGTGADYHDDVYRLYRAGILTGNDAKGTFTPKSTITRGAAAALVSRMADPSLRRAITLKAAPFEPVPANQLANLQSLRKRMSDAELQAAYNEALKIVTPLAGLSREDQLVGIAAELRRRFDSGMSYSTDEPHYNDPYGYLVLGTASCAGCTRATGLCLNILGIPYEHVNENQWSHQWCRVNIDGVYWICDAYGLYCGPEPAPYTHPYL